VEAAVLLHPELELELALKMRMKTRAQCDPLLGACQPAEVQDQGCRPSAAKAAWPGGASARPRSRCGPIDQRIAEEENGGDGSGEHRNAEP
jgi:hypothetical protein